MLRDVGGHIRNSAKRMAGLIDDMLDFAKGGLGGGLSLDRHPHAPLHEHLEQVIGELRDGSENAIEAQITLHHPVNCDPKRIAQVAPKSWQTRWSTVPRISPSACWRPPMNRVSSWRSRTRVSRSTELS